MTVRIEPLSPKELRQQRWFASKTKELLGVRLADWALMAGGRRALSVHEVVFAGGTREAYFVLLDLETGEGDAIADEATSRELFDLIASGRVVAGQKGLFRFTSMQSITARPRNVRRVAVPQSNTSVVYDEAYVLKVFRRLAGGVNPELEMGSFLTAAGFDKSPRLVGCAEYEAADGRRESLAVLQEYLPNSGDGWEYLRQRLERELRRVREVAAPLPMDETRHNEAMTGDDDAGLGDLRLLGTLTADLHVALSRDTDNRDFQPEHVSPDDLAKWTDDVLGQISRGLHALKAAASPRPSLQRQLGELLAREEPHRRLVAGLRSLGGDGDLMKIRVHGDYHLGQVLCTSKGFAVIDFEGEPARPLSARRQKQLALRDVAGMLRSVSYLRETALAEATEEAEGASTTPALALPNKDGSLGHWARAWEMQARSAFLEGYLSRAKGSIFLPRSNHHFERIIAILELEKAYYELEYEADNRPDWLQIPLRYLLRV